MNNYLPLFVVFYDYTMKYASNISTPTPIFVILGIYLLLFLSSLPEVLLSYIFACDLFNIIYGCINCSTVIIIIHTKHILFFKIIITICFSRCFVVLFVAAFLFIIVVTAVVLLITFFYAVFSSLVSELSSITCAVFLLVLCIALHFQLLVNSHIFNCPLLSNFCCKRLFHFLILVLL